MIQWLQSKIVMIVVGIILISSMISVFHYRMEEIEEEERYNRCKKISQVIADVSTSDADEMRQRITFDKDSEGIYFSPTIRDESYTIEIWTDLVRVKSEEGISSEKLRENVHLWNPETLNNTGMLGEEEKQWRDKKNPYLEVEAGSSDLEVTMLRLDDGTETESHVFISEVEAL